MEGEFKRGQFERDEPVIIEWDLRTDLGPSSKSEQSRKSGRSTRRSTTIA